jgi:DNA-directed RNA polymerase specialized sigma subunit
MQQKVRAAEKVFEGELQRTPTNGEIAEKMAMPQEESLKAGKRGFKQAA